MEAAFQMVRQVVVFLLLAALLTNLFMGTEYKKYFTYVTSLIVILLVLVPVLGFLEKERYGKKIIFFRKTNSRWNRRKRKFVCLEKKYENR